MPVRSAGRVQINFEVEPISQIEIMSKLPKMIFPWLWFEESANIPDYLINLLKYTLTLQVYIFTKYFVKFLPFKMENLFYVELFAFSRGKTFNHAVIWITMTYGLIGTVICTTVYILNRFTDIDVLEEEKAFTKSPHLISTLGSIKMVASIEDNRIDKKLKRNGTDKKNEDTNGDPSIAAVLLVSEVVTKAASAANKIRLQRNFDH